VFLGLRRYGGDRPRFLERRLSTDPEFFVQLLELVFKADGESDESSQLEQADTEESERRRQLARRAAELLLRWNTPPGLTETGTVDAEALRRWIATARERAATGRQRVADEYIGHILASLPEGSDGYPPHEAVRDVLEELRNGDIENGYQIGVLNARGITSSSLTEGGGIRNASLRHASGKYQSTLGIGGLLPPASWVSSLRAMNARRETRTSEPSYTTRRSGARARRRANTFRLNRARTTFSPPPLPTPDTWRTG
jgi:hypothetical protein